MAKDAFEDLGGERGGRASAEEHRDEGRVAPLRGHQIGLAKERLHVGLCEVPQARIRVEVAVPAPSETEGNMDVQAGRHERAPRWSTRSAAMNASCGTSTRPTRLIRSL